MFFQDLLENFQKLPLALESFSQKFSMTEIFVKAKFAGNKAKGQI